MNAGKPLRSPLRNSFAVFTDDEFLFQKVQVLFEGKFFEPFIWGSVIPFIRLEDVKKVIRETKLKEGERTDKMLTSLNEIDKAILNAQDKIKLLKQLKVAIAREVTGE